MKFGSILIAPARFVSLEIWQRTRLYRLGEALAELHVFKRFLNASPQHQNIYPLGASSKLLLCSPAGVNRRERTGENLPRKSV
jgi:hypothetical protein